MEETPVKVFLWAVPRSISTAFFRAMMNRPKTKVILEPYARAYYFGSERVSKRYGSEPVQDDCTYKDVKASIEQPYLGNEVVFAKDMSYYLVDKLHNIDYIPEGYIHTFLLRDPHKSVYSLYKMSLNKDLTGWDHFDAGEVGFKELHQTYKLITEQLGQEAIIIDADDLLKYPEPLLKAYCKKVGITYNEKMVRWDETPKDLQVFQEWMPWFEGVLTSKSFQPSATKPKSPMVMPDLPRHVLKAIEDNMPYYKEMHARRLRPDTLVVQ